MMQLSYRVKTKNVREWVIKNHPFEEVDEFSTWILKALCDIVDKLQELEERIEDLEREVQE